MLERHKLLFGKQMDQYQKIQDIHALESKEYKLNGICERKLCGLMDAVGDSASNNTFDYIKGGITLNMVLKNKKIILSVEAKALSKFAEVM